MNPTKRAILLIILLACQAFSQSSKPSGYAREAVISESAGTVHVNANNPRPLAQVLDAIQRKYAWVIDYEDPQYVSAGDLVEAPGDAHGQWPAGGSFTVEFPATAPDAEKTIRLIVDAYNKSKNPGRFEVRKGEQGSFYVIGTGAHDEKGGIASQTPVLDTPLTLPGEEHTVADTVRTICEQAGTQAHVNVALAISPRSLIDKNLVKVGGNKITARDLLQQSIQGTHHILYWRLLYDPTSKGYLLNLHAVRSAKES